MQGEFERWGIARLRGLTGILQLLAGIGLMVGLRWRPALTISAGGLMVMMLLALVVRVRTRDSIVQSLPAFVLMAINGFLLFESLR
jgi:uncharacterized membrane protein YphA (DoxX/SURF4 family)